jgi:hypothetical protein
MFKNIQKCAILVCAESFNNFNILGHYSQVTTSKFVFFHLLIEEIEGKTGY